MKLPGAPLNKVPRYPKRKVGIQGCSEVSCDRIAPRVHCSGEMDDLSRCGCGRHGEVAGTATIKGVVALQPGEMEDWGMRL